MNVRWLGWKMTLDEVKELCNKYSLRLEEAGRSGIWYAWTNLRENYVFGYHSSNLCAWSGGHYTFDEIDALSFWVKVEMKLIKERYMKQKMERIKDDF